jgi:hypothetical protein
MAAGTLLNSTAELNFSLAARALWLVARQTIDRPVRPKQGERRSTVVKAARRGP